MTRIFILLFLLLAFNGGFSQGTWSALTTGTNDRVESFTKDANYLYVAGKFTMAGGIQLCRSPVGMALPGPF